MKNNAMNKTKMVEMIIGCIIIGMISCFIWYFSYINEPIGDDVLGCYDASLTYYLDDYDFILGNKIISLPQIFYELKFIYTHWSGRMPGYFVCLIGRLLPKIIQAFFTSVIFTTNILLAMRIAYKNWYRVFSSPLAFVIVFLVAYWYRSSLYHSYMWTMVSIYSFGVMLCLIYYNISVVNYQSGKRCQICLLQIFGFIVGCSHEVISLCLIAMIGTEWLMLVVSKKEKWTYLFKHTGLGIGYLFGFFAPGNFYRMKQSHDIISTTFYERLRESLYMHIVALKSTVCPIFVACLIITSIVAVLLIRKDKKKLIKIVRNMAIPTFTMGGVSVVAWSLVSAKPMYGMDFWIMIAYALLLCFIAEFPTIVNKEKLDTIAIVCTIMILFGFIGLHIKELWLYSSVSLERRTLAKEAAENNIAQVEVPKFEDSLLGNRYSLTLNDQKQYDTAYYIAYYGTRLIIKNVK